MENNFEQLKNSNNNQKPKEFLEADKSLSDKELENEFVQTLLNLSADFSDIKYQIDSKSKKVKSQGLELLDKNLNALEGLKNKITNKVMESKTPQEEKNKFISKIRIINNTIRDLKKNISLENLQKDIDKEIKKVNNNDLHTTNNKYQPGVLVGKEQNQFPKAEKVKRDTPQTPPKSIKPEYKYQVKPEQNKIKQRYQLALTDNIIPKQKMIEYKDQLALTDNIIPKQKMIEQKDKPAITGTENEKLEAKNKVFIVDVSEIAKAMAWRQAEDRLYEILNKAEEDINPKRGWARSVWNNVTAPFRHPVAWTRKQFTRAMEDGYRRKFYWEALQEITNNHNLMSEIEMRASGLGWRAESRTITRGNERNSQLLDKVIQEYQNNVTEMIEKGQLVNNPQLNAEISRLMVMRVTHGLTREAFERELTSSLNNLKRNGQLSNQDFVQMTQRTREAEGLVYASNLWQIAQGYENQIKQQINSMGNIEKLSPEQKEKVFKHISGVLKLDVQLGLKLADIHNKKPKDTLNWLDQFAHRVQSVPILGHIVNPLTIGVASSLLTREGIRRIAGGAVIAASTMTGFGMFAPILTGAVMGGIYGAMRRNKELKFDRNFDLRRMALGEPSLGYRTDVMRQYSYDMRNSNEMMNTLNNIQNINYANLNENQKRDLADMMARFQVEAQREENYLTNRRNETVDLIKVGSQEEATEMKTSYVGKTDLKIALFNYLRNQNLIDQNNQAIQGSEFGDILNYRINELDAHINQQDRNFRGFRIKQDLIFGGIGFTSGLLGGVLAQEVGRYINVHWRGRQDYTTAIDWLRGKRPQESTSSIFKLFGGNQLVLDKGLNKNYDYVYKGNKFSIFIDEHGKPNFSKSILPKGWIYDNGQLKHHINGTAGYVLDYKNGMPPSEWQKISKELALGHKNVSAGQEVDYKGFQYGNTPPDKGVYAWPETRQNYVHNLGLHSDATELMMDYHKDTKTGEVLVDIRRMFGQWAVGSNKAINIEQALKSGEKFYFNMSPGVPAWGDKTQFNPISIEVGKDGVARIPAKIAKFFFAFDKSGNIIQDSGAHPGLHTVTMLESIEKYGKKTVENMVSISATLGKPAEIHIPKPGTDPKDFVVDVLFTPGQEAILANSPIAIPFVPRWQPETGKMQYENTDKNKKPSNSENESTSESSENIVRGAVPSYNDGFFNGIIPPDGPPPPPNDGTLPPDDLPPSSDIDTIIPPPPPPPSAQAASRVKVPSEIAGVNGVVADELIPPSKIPTEKVVSQIRPEQAQESVRIDGLMPLEVDKEKNEGLVNLWLKVKDPASKNKIFKEINRVAEEYGPYAVNNLLSIIFIANEKGTEDSYALKEKVAKLLVDIASKNDRNLGIVMDILNDPKYRNSDIIDWIRTSVIDANPNKFNVIKYKNENDKMKLAA